jgi:hypothetical protein
MAGTVKKPRAKKAAAEPVVHAIKGFDSKLQCREFQFEVGKTYEHEGSVRLCASGFHSVEGDPLDVLDYYPLIGRDGSLNRFCSVIASGEIGRDGSSKIVSGKLMVSLELTIPELIRKSVAFVVDACKTKTGDNVQAASGDYSKLAASGDYSKLAASGYYSQLAASGYYSKLAASGDYSKLAASGDYSQLAASGDSSKLAASGYYSKLAASGYYSKLAASGDYSKLAASGDYSQLAASGDSSQLAASGDSSQLAASGDYSQLAASGDSSKLAASGYYSKLAASGDYSKLAASGDSSQLEIKGTKSAAATVGPNSTVRAVAGTPLAICEYDSNGAPVGFATGVAGKGGVPADTWLIAKDGKLVPA